MKKCKFILLMLSTFMCWLVLLLSSCDDDKKSSSSHNPERPVVITSFYPTSGKIADKIILTGDNFGTIPNDIKVYFNKKQARVIGSDGKSMYVVVPRTPGEFCTVSVVIGKDSVVYDNEFLYKTSVTVSTVCGNGEKAYKEGTLSSAQIRAMYLCVDSEGNIFAVQRSDDFNILARINEEENIVTTLQTGLRTPNAPAVDLVTGVVTIPADEPTQTFYTADPSEGWAVRERTCKFTTPGLEAILQGSWEKYKHSMAVCQADGHFYTRFRGGMVVKIHPTTYEASAVVTNADGSPRVIGPAGDCYGVAFHPHNPTVLYMTFLGEAGEWGHAIYSMDVAAADPMSTLKRLTSPGNTSGGFRDGKLEQALFKDPCQIYFDRDAYLYIADRGNHCIRRITPDNMVETVVGIPGTSGYKDGSKDEALFNKPWGLGVSQEGVIYIADYDNARIRKLAVE